ncbi:MAG: hypothetical protein GKS00_17425 [Alphaproteobacteria bacterium]|nr:hypothetical protein [Alphaproteobacteria bacterium]
MSDILQRVDRKFEDDHQIRLMLSHDALLKREQLSTIGPLFDYWRECTTNRVPGKQIAFNPGSALSAEALRWVSWIDVRSDSALDFIWCNHVYGWLGDVSTEYCDSSGRKVRDHNVKLHRQYCAVEYQLCKSSKQPLYHEIKQHTGSIQRHYTRLLLPVLDEGGNVFRIFYACRRFLPI